MQTDILPEFLSTPAGREADAILRSCVHCGFCTATCPTYQLLGDELGRAARAHLPDQAGHGRPGADPHHPATSRSLPDLPLLRDDLSVGCALRAPARYRAARGRGARGTSLVRAAAALGARQDRTLSVALRPLDADRALGEAAAAGQAQGEAADTSPGRCLAEARRASSDAGARGVRPVGRDAQDQRRGGACAGAARHRSDRVARRRLLRCRGLSSERLDDGLDAMRRNIDAWWPEIEAGCEAILVTASGCGAMVKDYGHAWPRIPVYAERAARVAALARDPIEVIATGSRAARLAGGRSQGRLPRPLYAAARPAAQAGRGAGPVAARVCDDAGAGRPSVLRIRRDLFDHAARALRTSA
jgi:glycolate oxidase iron-sulfur subunit